MLFFSLLFCFNFLIFLIFFIYIFYAKIGTIIFCCFIKLGKTTLLRCVLGRLQPQSGVIRVFGQEPGSEYSPVPGPGVGYMPQELALFPDFTIKETLRYFGQLYRMSSKEIKARTKFLITLLHLPEKNRLVSQLSGKFYHFFGFIITKIVKNIMITLIFKSINRWSTTSCFIGLCIGSSSTTFDSG